MPDPREIAAITSRAAGRLDHAVRFDAGFSREQVNRTPAAQLGYAVRPGSVVMDVTVTGPLNNDTGLYPGAVLLGDPDPAPDDPVPPPAEWGDYPAESLVWVMPYPGQSLSVGSAGPARLTGVRTVDDDPEQPTRLVYALGAGGGANCPPAASGSGSGSGSGAWTTLTVVLNDSWFYGTLPAGSGSGSGSGSGCAPRWHHRVEYQRLRVPTCYLLGDPFCVTDPEGACVTRVAVACCGDGVPSRLYATITDPTAGCACLAGTYELEHDPDTGYWFARLACDFGLGLSVGLFFQCAYHFTPDFHFWYAFVDYEADGVPSGGPPLVATTNDGTPGDGFTAACSPFAVAFDTFAVTAASFSPTCPSGTPLTLVVTGSNPAVCGAGGGGPGGCAACDLEGLTPTVVVPDGPHAGTYTGSAWATTAAGGGGTALYTAVDFADMTAASFICYQADTLFPGVLAMGYAGNTPGAVVTCGPPSAVFAFPGAAAGSTGDVTVTT